MTSSSNPSPSEDASRRKDRDGLELDRERCFLVGAIPPHRRSEEEPLDELAFLVDTAGGEVVGRLAQRLERPHGRTYLGKGRLEELVREVRAAEGDTVVVDDDITPAQLSTLEEACRRKVIDRSEVILDIFASRARSHQAKLQVELAQMRYELPRLVRKWTHLERLGGGIGTRGPGESQIETDRRILRRKIASLSRELEEIEKRKVREVGARDELFTACLVGYTNAGKSSLLNRLTGARAFVENRLFATLDTLTRRLALPDGTEILLSDTVGFIRRLPHHLVASFHATLEEAAQADLLLHVVDASDPHAGMQMDAVDRTLVQLGMMDRERLHLFNKADAVKDPAHVAALRDRHAPNLLLSARTGEGTDALLALLQEKATAHRCSATLRFEAVDGRRLAMVNERGRVEEVRYEDDEVVVRAHLAPEDLERLKRLPGPMSVTS